MKAKDTRLFNNITTQNLIVPEEPVLTMLHHIFMLKYLQ